MFKDNFSKQSDLYVKYRPHYPEAMFAYLASLTEGHELAWDCGTGNGQAATGLTKFYDSIIATDPSAQQIANALPHPRVTYKVEKAEQNSIASGSVDLLTIANAVHWFDFDVFYKEVNRVLKPNGIIAAWSYCVPSISPEINAILQHYHDHTLNDFWVYENRLVEKAYTTLPFPFPEINAPDFWYEKSMTLDDVIGLLNTWSATQKFITHHGYNPTDEVRQQLAELWKDENEEKTVRWALALKVGRVAKV